MNTGLNRIFLSGILYTFVILINGCGGSEKTAQSPTPVPSSSPTPVAANASPSVPPPFPNAKKLTVEKYLLAKKAADGKLTPVEDAVFKRGEDIHFVLINVGKFEKGKDGKNWLDMDMQVKNPKGQVALSKKSLLGEKGHRALDNNIASSPYGTVNTTPKVEVGKYEIELTVYDKVGGGQVTTTKSFTLK